MKLFVLSYATAVYALFFNIQPVLAGVLNRAFGFNEQQLGELLGLASVAAAVALSSSYFWVNRFRCRSAIRLGLGIALAGLLLLLPAATFADVSIGLVLLSFGLAIITAPVLVSLSSLANPTRSFGTAISAMMLLASVCSYLIPAVLYPGAGYSAVIVFLIVLVAPILLLVSWVPEPERRAHGVQSNAKVSGRYGWLSLLVVLVFFAGLNSNWAFVELLGLRMGVTSQMTGLSISVALLLGVLGSVAAALINQRLCMPQVMSITAALFGMYSAVLVASDGLVAPIVPFATALVLFNIAWNFSLPFVMELVRRCDSSGRLLGQVPTAQMLGAAVGTFVAGPLLKTGGANALYLFLMLCTLLSAIGLVALQSRVE